MTTDLEQRLREALPLLDGLETGQDCEEYAYAHGNGFQAMTHCPSAFEALRSLPEAIGELARLRAENDHLAEVLARIAYEGLDDPARAAHDALKATARPLQEGSRHE